MLIGWSQVEHLIDWVRVVRGAVPGSDVAGDTGGDAAHVVGQGFEVRRILPWLDQNLEIHGISGKFYKLFEVSQKSRIIFRCMTV